MERSSVERPESFTDDWKVQVGAVVVGAAFVANEVFDAAGFMGLPYEIWEWFDIETVVKAGGGALLAKWGLNRLFSPNDSR